jgi:hypothetical protein
MNNADELIKKCDEEAKVIMVRMDKVLNNKF